MPYSRTPPCELDPNWLFPAKSLRSFTGDAGHTGESAIQKDGITPSEVDHVPAAENTSHGRSLWNPNVRHWRQALILTTTGVTLVGCGLFPKESSPPISPDRLPATQNVMPTSRQAVLAGQVVDTFNQRRGGVQLAFQPTDGGEAVSAITNSEGYFTVSNLQSGKRYKIQARAQNGTVLSTGYTEATAPNVVVLIKLNDSRTEVDGKSAGMSGTVGGKHSSIAGSDDFSPVWSKGNPASTGQGDRLGAAPDVNQAPKNTTPGIRPRLGSPVTGEANPQSGGPVPVRPEYIADAGNGASIRPPALNIAGPTGNLDRSSPTKSEYGSINYFDFTVSDLDGRPARIADYRGRLTLINLWNTNCSICQDMLVELKNLQKQHRHQGLVVMGLAVKEEGTTEAKAAKIRWRTNPKSIDYPQLMEGKDAALEAFRAERYPMLILLDEQGREVWRGTGFNPDIKAQLERELTSRLR
jgi:thiol-disulfide isomerase/thioredoxin